MSSWNQFFRTGRGGSGEYWLTVSDLMAALMVIFLFISIAFMQRVMRVVVAWNETQEQIFEELTNQFQDNLEEWNAEFDEEKLIIRFRDPETLFNQGQATLRPEFERILGEFCPRYFSILDDYTGEIEEVRIEGHTSPEWNVFTPSNEAFYNNMQLSQARTRSVLEHCFELDGSSDFSWLPSKIRAVGMSSSDLMLNDDGEPDFQASRRVEFRIRTRAEERIASILGGLQ